mgnify:CR=1 FL=1
MKTIKLILVLIVFTLNYAQAQRIGDQTTSKNNDIMKTYVIERIIPGAGELTKFIVFTKQKIKN